MADTNFRVTDDVHFKNTSDVHWKHRSILCRESISLTDTFSRKWSIYRTFTETLHLTDTVSKRIAKTFTETLHLTDTFSRIATYYRTFTETIHLTDTIKVAKVNLVNLIKKLIQLMDIRRW